MNPDYFDIHSHVTRKDYDQDIEEVLARMRDDKVATITVGVDYETSEEAVRFADSHENFYATLGLHPTDTVTETFSSAKYKPLLGPKVVGVGECGLDFFRIREPSFVQATEGEEKKRQWREFEKQMEFAVQNDLPLMIHCRPTRGTMDAYLEMLGFLESSFRSLGSRVRGNVHFFVGDVAVARRFYNIGFTTSFTGVLTFTHDYDEVVKFAPLDRLLTETDSPFVAPAPFRGRRNEPAYVKYVVSAIARIRSEEEERVRQAVVDNAIRVFRLKA